MNVKTMLSDYTLAERTVVGDFAVTVTAYVDDFNAKAFNYPKLNFKYLRTVFM